MESATRPLYSDHRMTDVADVPAHFIFYTVICDHPESCAVEEVHKCVNVDREKARGIFGFVRFVTAADFEGYRLFRADPTTGEFTFAKLDP